jgi:signal transduction histidine kinase
MAPSSTTRCTVATSIRLTGNECWLSRDCRDQLFIIVREALRNSLAHAGDATVAVWVDVTARNVHAVIEDNGTGFNTTTTERSGEAHGIASMRERTTMLGGTLTLSSTLGAGTVIDIRVPLPERQGV